jgi:hypothetical protein
MPAGNSSFYAIVAIRIDLNGISVMSFSTMVNFITMNTTTA